MSDDVTSAMERLQEFVERGPCYNVDIEPDLIDDLRTLLDAAPAWRTMDSAPKDGTNILVMFQHFGLGPVFGCWALEHEDGSEYHKAGWFCWGPYLCGYTSAPSHWMPLPHGPIPAVPETTP